jgi:1-deoxyxylulose-5-phosphate synthase
MGGVAADQASRTMDWGVLQRPEVHPAPAETGEQGWLRRDPDRRANQARLCLDVSAFHDSAWSEAGRGAVRYDLFTEQWACGSRPEDEGISAQRRGATESERERNRATVMEYARVGSSGLTVSRIGLGMMSYGDPARQVWALPEDEAEPIVRRAAESGVTFFDTADMYSGGVSEEITGRLLARYFPHRDDYIVATKVYYPTGPGPNDRGLSRKHILASIDGSLRRLRTDHVDLYQIHRWDDETPIEETMAAMHEVVQAGKARYLGASTMCAWQFAKAQYCARAAGLTTFVSMQGRYNLVNRDDEREMIPLCHDQGVGLLPYSPLARGLLAGTRERSGERTTARATADKHEYRAADFDVAEAVRAVAAGQGVPPAQIALAWLFGKPGVSAAIVGVTRPEHLSDAVSALAVTLSAAEIEHLQAPYVPHPTGGYT